MATDNRRSANQFRMLLAAHLLATQGQRLGRALHGKVEELRETTEGERRVKQQHELVRAAVIGMAEDQAACPVQPLLHHELQHSWQ